MLPRGAVSSQSRGERTMWYGSARHKRLARVNAALLALATIGGVCGGERAFGALGDGLEGYWRFENNGLDSSNAGRDLSLVGGAGFSTGLLGNALDLHRNNAQSATRPTSDASFNFGGGAFTVQVWANFTSSVATNGQSETLIEKFFSSNGPGWSLETSGGNGIQHIGLHTVTDPAISAAVTIAPATWHHIVVTRSGGLEQLYYDGSQVASLAVANSIGTNTVPLLIGKRNNISNNQDHSVDGRLD